jgi:hypothetical protein
MSSQLSRNQDRAISEGEWQPSRRTWSAATRSSGSSPDRLADTESLPWQVVIEGEPGIGKTTVWREAVEEARRHGYRVLATRPGSSEAHLAFAGLTDLLEDALDEMLPALPRPQARALRIALLLDDPGSAPAEPRSVAAALRLAALTREPGSCSSLSTTRTGSTRRLPAPSDSPCAVSTRLTSESWLRRVWQTVGLSRR